VSVYERLEALNIGRCGINASQPRNCSWFGRVQSAIAVGRLAPAICVICFCWTSCSTRNRSRSRWLKAIRSVSMGPSATYESGHFYFAQTGHSHFAATKIPGSLTCLRCAN
jgi:hypothetical protein